MRFEMLYAKIHRARVSDANIDYVGSVSIYEGLAKRAGILEGMKVDILDVNNGERFSTYVMYSKKKGDICINGAAARKVQVGDVVIIAVYALLDKGEIDGFKPYIVYVDENNEVIE